MKPWHGVVSEQEEKIYAAAGWGRSSGMGRRPALLIIDVQYRTVGTVPLPIEQAQKEFATSCGEAGWNAVAHIKTLLDEFRARKWPVIYPHVAPKLPIDGGRLAEKAPSMWSIPPKGYEIISELAPEAGEILLPKKHPSAFFGTPLTSHLIELGVDTLVLTGCTTSGCIRASAVDGFSLNFHIIVPVECVYDRGPTSHAVNLFDLSQKYAEVLTAAEVLNSLDQIGASEAR